jgi:hypothetical protein
MQYATPFSRIQGARRTAYTPRRRYSVTGDVLSFRRCHRQYGFEAVHGYQPSRTSQVFYGTVIHQVLDRAHAHYHGLIEPETEGALPTDEDIGLYYEEVRQSLRTRGVRGARPAVEEQALRVLQIFNRVEGETLYPRVVDSEHRMQADEDTYVLHGTVDLLVNADNQSESPDALEIWDYKGQRRPKPGDPRLQDYLFQMMVYADLYRRRHGVYPLQAQLYFLNELDQDRPMETNREEALLTVEYTEEQVERALNAFRGSVGDIEASRSEEDWPAPAVGHGPGEETCTICDYRWNCPTVRDDPYLNDKIPIRYP